MMIDNGIVISSIVSHHVSYCNIIMNMPSLMILQQGWEKIESYGEAKVAALFN